jgi:hypothetical protein
MQSWNIKAKLHQIMWLCFYVIQKDFMKSSIKQALSLSLVCFLGMMLGLIALIQARGGHGGHGGHRGGHRGHHGHRRAHHGGHHARGRGHHGRSGHRAGRGTGHAAAAAAATAASATAYGSWGGWWSGYGWGWGWRRGGPWWGLGRWSWSPGLYTILALETIPTIRTTTTTTTLECGNFNGRINRIATILNQLKDGLDTLVIAIDDLKKYASSQKETLESVESESNDQQQAIATLQNQIAAQEACTEQDIARLEARTNEILAKQKLQIKQLGEVAAQIRMQQELQETTQTKSSRVQKGSLASLAAIEVEE